MSSFILTLVLVIGGIAAAAAAMRSSAQRFAALKDLIEGYPRRHSDSAGAGSTRHTKRSRCLWETTLTVSSQRI
jgi:hypothetical protein